MKKLSAYTIARNCTDATDCKAGIEELKEYFRVTEKPCKSAYVRFYKLNEKLKIYLSSSRPNEPKQNYHETQRK